MQSKPIRILLLIIDILIVISVIVSALCVFFTGGEGNMVFDGFDGFRYFTIDSNLLLGIVFAMGLGFRARAVKDGSVTLPLWLHAMQHAAVVGIFLTFLTTAVFLTPLMGFPLLYLKENFLMHGSTPLLGIASFLLTGKEPRLLKLHILTGLLPAIVYGVFYVTFTLTGVWEDFYMFNMNGMLPLTVAVITAVELAASYALYRFTQGGTPKDAGGAGQGASSVSNG